MTTTKTTDQRLSEILIKQTTMNDGIIEVLRLLDKRVGSLEDRLAELERGQKVLAV